MIGVADVEQRDVEAAAPVGAIDAEADDAIAVRLERLSGDVLNVEEGSLYPALYRMEARGWLGSEWSTTDTGRRARFYKLTRTGRAQLVAESKSWYRLTLAVNTVMKS